MSIHPPESRVWWNEPIARGELVWIALAFIWGLIMFFMMILWHSIGDQNLSNEAYRTTPGKGFLATKASLEIAGQKAESKITDPQAIGVSFELDLPSGVTTLSGTFTAADGTQLGAYYAVVKRL